MVAHPDDCVIFAYGFIMAYPEFDWTICYLTYDLTHERGQEVAAFWNTHGITTDFLGFIDNPTDITTKQLTFDTVSACMSIQSKISAADLVLTHGPAGDYGHVHHKFVYKCCKDHPTLVVFSRYITDNQTFSLPSNYPVSFDEFKLPVHKEALMAFIKDPATHKHQYKILNNALQLAQRNNK